MSGLKPPPMGMSAGRETTVFPQTQPGVRVGAGAAGTRDGSHGGHHGPGRGRPRPSRHVVLDQLCPPSPRTSSEKHKKIIRNKHVMGHRPSFNPCVNLTRQTLLFSLTGEENPSPRSREAAQRTQATERCSRMWEPSFSGRSGLTLTLQGRARRPHPAGSISSRTSLRPSQGTQAEVQVFNGQETAGRRPQQ